MSRDLRTDQKWSFAMPLRFLVFLPCKICHDARSEHQLYLYSLTAIAPDKILGTLSQTVASDDGKSVTTRTILEKNIPTSEVAGEVFFLTQFCIDEVSRKLYVIFRGTTTNSRGEKYFQVAVSDISFGQPDTFGYRRVTVDGKGNMYTINFGEIFPFRPNFFLHPFSGEVLFQLRDSRGDTNFRLNGVLELSRSTFEVKILGKVYTGITAANISGYRFSRNGKRLTVFYSTTSEKADKRSVTHWYSIDNNNFKLEKELSFDHFDMIKKLFPPDLFFGLHTYRDENVKRACQTTRFGGHLFKYTFLSFIGGAAAVKHFDRWVTDNGKHERQKKNSVWFLSVWNFRFSLQLELQEFQTNALRVKMRFMLGSLLYYTICDQIGGRVHLHRLDLGDRFKDYRICAHCGCEETNKRRNAQGKRIAQFKVCRECKKLKLHHQWWKFACHFCSEQCMKKGWKKHKQQHL